MFPGVDVGPAGEQGLHGPGPPGARGGHQRRFAAGADANARNRYGVTPLSLACTNGSEAIVTLLLEAGADPNAALRGNETALMTAARTGTLGPVLEYDA